MKNLKLRRAVAMLLAILSLASVIGCSSEPPVQRGDDNMAVLTYPDFPQTPADKNSWDAIVSLIPLMREDGILEEESVKLGKFQGYETIAYVDNIMNLYDAFCTICPSI